MNSPSTPNNLNFPQRSVNPEQPTDLRYSLAYELISSKDRLVNHPSGPTRLVTYPRTEGERERIREQLLEKRLILGKIISELEEPEQTFVVPISARPLAYDAMSQAQGSYSYNDSKLFYDLGHMLATVLSVDQRKYVIKGDIGHAVAIVEFIRPGEKQLLFVPGVEHLLEPLGQDMNALGYYAEVLVQEFGDRFGNAALPLRMGFAQALSEQGA